MSFWEYLTRAIFFSIVEATDSDQDYKEDSCAVRFSIVEKDSIVKARLEDIKRAEAEDAEIISAETIYYIILVLYLYIRVTETARATEVGVSD